MTRGYLSNVHLAGRNLDFNWLTDFVARDRPYNEFVKEMLTAAGDKRIPRPHRFFKQGENDGGHYSYLLQDVRRESTPSGPRDQSRQPSAALQRRRQ